MLSFTCDKRIAIVQQQEMLASVEREMTLIAEVRVASPTHCGWVGGIIPQGGGTELYEELS